MVTTKAVIDVLMSMGNRWTFTVETGDALISRARSTAASQWLKNTNDDVLVMTDDDFYFPPSCIDRLANLAADIQGVAAGVTPLRSGEYTAIVPLEPSTDEPWRNPQHPPMEIKRAGGLIAYHRSVFEKLTHTLPLLHRNDPRLASFWPFFAPAMVNENGDDIYLSEDYACHERARKVGVSVWVHPACQVEHLAEFAVNCENMDVVRQLFNQPLTQGA
jgi:hypothetical protein